MKNAHFTYFRPLVKQGILRHSIGVDVGRFSFFSKLLAIALLCITPAHAESDLAPAEAPPVMEVNAAPVVPETRRFEIIPQVSVITIRDFAMPFLGHRVNYMDSLEGMPMLTLGLSTALGAIGDFGFSVQASVGYGARAASFTTFSLASDPPSQLPPQSLRMQWLPAILSAKVTYRTPQLSSIRPSLSVGAGSLTVIQTAQNPALNRTVGIPVLVISPQLNFIDLTTLHWLGGFSFGATWMQGLGGDSRVNSVSLDLGINLIL